MGGHHGYYGYPYASHGFHYGKRSADAEASADAFYGAYGYGPHHGYGHHAYGHHGYSHNGYYGYPYAYHGYAHAYGKRSADAEASADAFYGAFGYGPHHGYGHHAYGHHG